MPKPAADELTLLKAVARDRDDDLPRLVYADWLDERGRTARAEFIRLQIAEERKPPRREEAYDVWTHRERRLPELLRENRAVWLRELPKWAFGSGTENVVFVRGFIETFFVLASLFVRNGPALLDRTPVRHIQLNQAGNLIDEIVRCVWLTEVPVVDFTCQTLGSRGMIAFREATWLSGTVELILSGADIDDNAAIALAQNPHLCRVEELHLGANEIGYRGADALAKSPLLPSLRTVHLGRNPVDMTVARRLFYPRRCLL